MGFSRKRQLKIMSQVKEALFHREGTRAAPADHTLNRVLNGTETHA